MKFDDSEFRELIHNSGTRNKVAVSAEELERVLNVLREMSISYDLVMGFVEGLAKHEASGLEEIVSQEMPNECRLPMIQHSCAVDAAKELVRFHPPAFGLVR